MNDPGGTLKGYIVDYLTDYFNSQPYKIALYDRMAAGLYKDINATDPQERYTDSWYSLITKGVYTQEQVEQQLQSMISDDAIDMAAQGMINIAEDIANMSGAIVQFMDEYVPDIVSSM